MVRARSVAAVTVVCLTSVGLAGCARVTRAEPNARVAADAGDDAGVRDAAGPTDAARDASAGPKSARVYVPFPDCTRHDPGAGVFIEGCDCEPSDDVICCDDRAVFECTGFGWRVLQGESCSATGGTPHDAAGWDSSQPAQCMPCERGTAGCYCREDQTCAPGLICVESFCGSPVD